MEAYTQACWNTFLKGVESMVEDQETQDFLKESFMKSLLKNESRQPNAGVNANKYAKSVGKGATSTRAPTAYNIYWKQWKEENTADEFDDPDHDGQKMKPKAYFNAHVWGKMSDSEKESLKEKLSPATSKQSKEKKDLSAFGLFKDVHRPLLQDGMTKEQLENLKHPENQAPINLYRYLQFVWSTHVKKNNSLASPYNDLSEKLKEQNKNGKANYDTSSLPHLDVEALISQDFSDLQFVEE